MKIGYLQDRHLFGGYINSRRSVSYFDSEDNGESDLLGLWPLDFGFLIKKFVGILFRRRFFSCGKKSGGGEVLALEICRQVNFVSVFIFVQKIIWFLIGYSGFVQKGRGRRRERRTAVPALNGGSDFLWSRRWPRPRLTHIFIAPLKMLPACIPVTAAAFVCIMAGIGYATGRAQMIAPLWALATTGLTCAGCYGVDRCRRRCGG